MSEKAAMCTNCGYENCQCDANADAIRTIREIVDANGGESVPFIDDAVKHCIAAAEERGRRRGVEESDKLRVILLHVRRWMRADSPSWVKAEADTALGPLSDLAPRSSAPDSVTPSALPRDEGKDCRCHEIDRTWIAGRHLYRCPLFDPEDRK